MNTVPCSFALASACAKSHRIRIVNNSFTCIASFLSELQVNTKSITQAFKKYCDMVISQFDPEEEARLIAGFYKEMSARKPFIEWFKGYVQKKDDADFILTHYFHIPDSQAPCTLIGTNQTLTFSQTFLECSIP